MASADEEVRIILLGKTGSGKSSTGNTILGRECFQKERSPESVTKTCERRTVEEDDQTISVIDTPGLFDTTMTEQDLKAEIVKCVEMSVPGPHVFLLVIRLDVPFTDEEKNTVKWIQENFGEEAAHYTIILFTHADSLDKPLDNYISKSNDLKAVVNECGDRIHSFNNNEIKNRSQVTKLLEEIEKMVKKNGGQHYTNEMYKEAQNKIEWESWKQYLIEKGTTALTVIGGGAVAVGAAVVAAGGTGPALALAGQAATAAGTAAVAAAKGSMKL